MRLFVDGIGLWAPGMASWPEGTVRLNRCDGEALAEAHAPRPALLSAREQRRTGLTVRLALEVALQAVNRAGLGGQSLASIFATANGDSDILNYMCKTLVSAPETVSPTRFHNSVHNAAGGYWSIGRGCTKPLNCLSMGRYSAAGGLLDAAMQLAAGEPQVLLCAYDIPAPEPLKRALPIESLFGAALVLGSTPSPHSIASLELSRQAGAGAPPLEDEALQRLREDNPAAELLPLLVQLARGEGGELALSLGPALQLNIGVSPRC
ncbi:beta-ketoacyl synthase chain length factor [Aestuariirhabdus litorea]|uniref:Beta-ketoacyl synthase-like N-terminal domain-containing protein n=1 Tax=Aestuariirhabdus litorea TaxID=2528527 RepID=A0A3P3VS10_9GAMM|nr:beta-ketoacyl synthase chain length factor [Aestuariirhabdus litorea]RRJ85234.1 hypothetical protein D0544_09250 [Aestuariirhabdus litorea]RWW98454.1 hypothetical protein DZC74_09235 [Endozoicomonadaceae bacterium GTF-13]